MTTKDIKADYGAAGDGQKLTTTITASGTTVSSPTALWSPGDVGKSFGSLELWDLSSTYFVTIASVAGDGKSITLSTAVGHSRSAQSTTIEWGTDDTPAFAAFMDDYNDNSSSVILEIPSGRYIFATSVMGPFYNIKTLEVHGDPDDPPILSDLCSCGSGYFIGSSIGQNQSDNLHSARTDTVAAGSSAIQLVDASQRTRFSAGTWALMTGLELDGGSLGGSPTTPHLYEFVFISSISVGGAITISAPLANTYKSTWPVYSAGSAFALDYGGPATLYALNVGWDVDHIYQNIIFDSEFGGIPAQGRNITVRDSTALNDGITATVCRDYTLDNVDMPDNNEEIFDKIITNVTLTDSTFVGIKFQSPAPVNLTMTRCTVTGAFYTPLNATLIDCDIQATDVKLGPANAAGVSVTATGTTFGGFAEHQAGGETDVFGTGGWTLTGGVFSRIKIGSFVPPTWAIPGRRCMLTGSGYFTSVFRVIDVYEDGTNIYVSTDLTGMPNIPSSGGAYAVAPLPPAITFSDCDGCVDAEAWSLAPAGYPLYSYFRRAYSGNIGTSEPPAQVVGRLVSVTITVSGYSGGTLGLDGPLVLRLDTGAFAAWTPSVDLTTAGTRVITPSGGDPSLGSDSGLALPAAQVWMVANQVTPKMTGSTGSGSLSLEIITNQFSAAAVAQLRLRLHA